jgi:hypothetical protein
VVGSDACGNRLPVHSKLVAGTCRHAPYVKKKKGTLMNDRQPRRMRQVSFILVAIALVLILPNLTRWFG